MAVIKDKIKFMDLKKAVAMYRDSFFYNSGAWAMLMEHYACAVPIAIGISVGADDAD
jgi:hypothetical protein